MKLPPWQPMETAPKDRDILVIWRCIAWPGEDSSHGCTAQRVGLGKFNGIFEETSPGSGFWYGYCINGRITSRHDEWKPIAWMELPPINLENYESS